MRDIPNHWASSLQALSYWIAYKRQYFHGHLLPEGAIVAELTQLLSAKVKTGYVIECERMYKDFGCKTLNSKRMDIAIGEQSASKPKKNGRKIGKNGLLEAVEIKRYEGNKNELYEDMEKLSKLDTGSKELRKFLIVVGQNSIPDLFFTSKHIVKKMNVYSGNLQIEAFPRMGKKAYSTKKKGFNGAFSTIIEVL